MRHFQSAMPAARFILQVEQKATWTGKLIAVDTMLFSVNTEAMLLEPEVKRRSWDEPRRLIHEHENQRQHNFKPVGYHPPQPYQRTGQQCKTSCQRLWNDSITKDKQHDLICAAEAPPLAAAEFSGILSGETDSIATASGGGTAGFTLAVR
jgi:hypothetical protein